MAHMQCSRSSRVCKHHGSSGRMSRCQWVSHKDSEIRNVVANRQAQVGRAAEFLPKPYPTMSRKFETPGRYSAGSIILPMMPERVDTFIFTIINRMNPLTVFGLIFIRIAISLLVRPSTNN